MPPRTAILAAAGLAVLLTLVPAGAQRAAAFLDLGLGVRAVGMGSALGAAATGADAIYYNPAGLAATQGRTLITSVQPMSLDRTQATLAGSMNLRGGLAFGLAWIYASPGPLQARTGAGDVIAGDLDDDEQAIAFGLGTRVNDWLLLGASLKLLSQKIAVPGAGTSSASGRAVDLGGRLLLGRKGTVSMGVRNLFGKQSWTVRRAASQSSASEEKLATTPYAAFAGRWRRTLLSVDAEWFDAGGASRARLHLGTEIDVAPMLSLRAGLYRIGDADGAGLPTLGVSIRPMHNETLQFHYAWVGDDLGAGGRTVIGLGGSF